MLRQAWALAAVRAAMARWEPHSRDAVLRLGLGLGLGLGSLILGMRSCPHPYSCPYHPSHALYPYPYAYRYPLHSRAVVVVPEPLARASTWL